MIYKPGTTQEVTGVYARDSNGVRREITAMYTGDGRLFWQLARSCYGTGVWLQDRPWLNSDRWKNDK